MRRHGLWGWLIPMCHLQSPVQPFRAAVDECVMQDTSIDLVEGALDMHALVVGRLAPGIGADSVREIDDVVIAEAALHPGAAAGADCPQFVFAVGEVESPSISDHAPHGRDVGTAGSFIGSVKRLYHVVASVVVMYQKRQPAGAFRAAGGAAVADDVDDVSFIVDNDLFVEVTPAAGVEDA